MNKVRPLRSFRTRCRIGDIALSPAGGLLAAAGIRTGSGATTEALLTVWELDRSEPLLKVRRPAFEVRVGFSPDGKRLALIANGFELFDPRSGRELIRIHSPAAPIREWSFAPDGKLVAIGTEKGCIQIVNLRDYSSGAQLTLDNRDYRLAFTPDGRSLAVTTRLQGRAVVTLYSVDRLRPIRTLASPLRGRILGAWFGSRHSLVMVNEKGRACVWEDREAEPRVLQLDFSAGFFRYLLLPSQPNRLVVESLKTITRQKKPLRLFHKVLVAIHRLDERGGVHLFEGHNGLPGGIACDPRQNLLATASTTQVRLWDLAPLLEND